MEPYLARNTNRYKKAGDGRLLSAISVLLAFALFSSVPGYADSESCHFAFSGSVSHDALLAALAKSKVNGERTHSSGKGPPAQRSVRVKLREKQEHIYGWLRSRDPQLTFAEFSERLRTHVAKLQMQMSQDPARVEKDNERREAQDHAISNEVSDGSRVILHRLEPETFQFPVRTRGKISGLQVATTKPFGLAATLTTQGVWMKVCEAAERRLPDQYNAGVSIEGGFFFNTGYLHPVETRSYAQVQKWLGLLNRLVDLRDPVISEVLPNHQPGSIYRLPTEAEWAQVAVHGRLNIGPNVNDALSPEATLRDYAWTRLNSDFIPRDVAQRLPFVVGGHEFYDIYGNVSQLMAQGPALNPINEIGADSSAQLLTLTRGGNVKSKIEDLDLAERVPTGSEVSSVGFRIAVDYNR